MCNRIDKQIFSSYRKNKYSLNRFSNFRTVLKHYLHEAVGTEVDIQYVLKRKPIFCVRQYKNPAEKFKDCLAPHLQRTNIYNSEECKMSLTQK